MWSRYGREVHWGHPVKQLPLVKDPDKVSANETAETVACNGDSGNFLVILLELLNFFENLCIVQQ